MVVLAETAEVSPLYFELPPRMPFDDFAMLSEEPRDTANMIGDLGLLGDGRSVEALQPPARRRGLSVR